LLGRKRKARQIAERAKIVGMRPGRNTFRSVRGHMIVRVADGPAQPFELQAFELVSTSPLDRIQGNRWVAAFRHGL
jgi:hypothetical protein